MTSETIENKEIRVRFAPSPTGSIHIGNLRTALFAWLYARNQKGSFLLRLEDTDQKRFETSASRKIFETLKWVEMDIDEGLYLNKENEIKQKGDFGPYVQSERLDIYKKYIKKLLENNQAYYCFCTSERLKKVKEAQQQQRIPPMYDKKCRNLESQEIEKKIKNGEKYVIRMKVPENKTIKFNDKVFGDISVETNTIDDQILIKADNFPTYHFAVVVDDHLMKISHIFRGEEWIPSTPKHILLYKFFGWKAPKFVHLPNVLGENKKKLSKRQGDISVEDFKSKGYLQEALINFLALLGWNPKSNQEVMSRKELIEKFSISGLHRAGAIFNYEKLDWINGQYLKNKSEEEIYIGCNPYLNQYLKNNKLEKNSNKLARIISVEKVRIKKFSDITENLDIYLKEIDYPSDLLKWKDMNSTDLKKALERVLEIVSRSDLSDLEIFQKTILASVGEARGEHLWPLRVALSGQERSASPFELAWILGKKETLKRIESAIVKIK